MSIFRDTDYETLERDAREIRAALERNPQKAARVRCFSRADAAVIESKLTPAQRKRTYYTWLVFPKENP